MELSLSPCFLLGLLLVLAPGLAVAGPAVVHSSNLNADQAAALAKQALGSDDFTVAGDLDDLVGAIGDAVVVSGATTRECAQANPSSVAAVLAAARMQLDEMEYATGVDLLVRASVALPCGAESATRGQLYDLFFLRGLAAFNNDDTESAKAAFAAAAVIDTTRPWDESYPPTAKLLFHEALQAAVAPENVRDVRSSIEGVYLDGKQLPTTGGRIAVGGHVVVAGGKALWLEVPANARPLLVTTAAGVSSSVLAGESTGAQWLANVAEERGWTDVLVVSEGVARRFSGGAWAGGNLLDTQGPPPALIAGIGTAAGGVVVLGIGLGLRGAAGAEATSLGLTSTETGWTVDVSDTSSTAAAKAKRETFAADYPALKQQGDAGIALAAIGGAVTAAGLVLTVVTLAKPGKAGGVAAAPWINADAGGVAFGVVGRW